MFLKGTQEIVSGGQVQLMKDMAMHKKECSKHRYTAIINVHDANYSDFNIIPWEFESL